MHINEGVLDGGAHSGAGRHVHHPLDAFSLKNACDERSVTQVALEKADTVGTVLVKEHSDVRAFGAHIVVVVHLTQNIVMRMEMVVSSTIRLIYKSP